MGTEKQLSKYLDKVVDPIVFTSRGLAVTIFRDWPKYKANNFKMVDEIPKDDVEHILTKSLSNSETKAFIEMIIFGIHYATWLAEKKEGLERADILKGLNRNVVRRISSLWGLHLNEDEFYSIATSRDSKLRELVSTDESGKNALGSVCRDIAKILDSTTLLRAETFIYLDMIALVQNIQDVFQETI